MFSVDLENLEGDVAPAMATHFGVGGSIRIRFKDHQAFARLEHTRSRLCQAQGFAIELSVRRQIPDADPNPDLGDAAMPGWHQRHAIAFRISQCAGRCQALPGDQQFSIAAGRRIRQGAFVMINLEDAAKDVVAMLVLSAPDRQHMIQGHTRLTLPERQHRLEVIGGEADVEPGFGELHGFLTCTSSLPVEWVSSNKCFREPSMKAAIYYENGPPDVLRYEDVPDPQCHPKGILIRVEAVSIEGGDTLNRHGGPLMTNPHVVGYQAAGTIIEVGAEVTHMKVGQKVATTGGWGSHAELRAVSAKTAWVIPDGMDVRHAAVIPVTFGTADDCLFEFGRLQKGETVMIQAGASGVGVAAIQLAARAGASMILATASSDERLEKLKAIGLTHGINYKTHDVVQEVMRLTDKKGVNVIVDSVGGPTLQSSIGSLAYRGRVSMVGAAGREPMRVDVGSMMGGNRTLSGVFLGAEIATDRVQKNIAKLIADVASGELKVMIDRTFPLSEAAAAHRYIESRQAVGRVLLIP